MDPEQVALLEALNLIIQHQIQAYQQLLAQHQQDVLALARAQAAHDEELYQRHIKKRPTFGR